MQVPEAPAQAPAQDVAGSDQPSLGRAAARPPSSLEVACRGVGGDGFDLRKSEVGKHWYRELAAQPTLAAEYKAVGKGYAAQREFRSRWAAQVATEMEHTRVQAQTNTDELEDQGTYESLPQLRLIQVFIFFAPSDLVSEP